MLNDIVEAYLLVGSDIAYFEYQLDHLGLPSIRKFGVRCLSPNRSIYNFRQSTVYEIRMAAG